MANSAVTTYLEAEVKCLHCGHTTGVIRRERGTPGGSTTFHSTEGTVSTVKRLTDLRCDRCHGSVYTDEVELRYVYPRIDFLDLDDERPRRGRPPKRLVEMRQAALKSA